MARYILRRLLQMGPTLLGVLVLTFLLFHVVGGSPAALTLGEHVSAQALEEFDEQRGFNRPLFMGAWTSTRAMEEYRAGRPGSRFPLRPEGEERPAGEGLLPPGRYALALRFPLPAAPRYRMDLELRAAEGTRAVWMTGEDVAGDAVRSGRRGAVLTFRPEDGLPVLHIEGGEGVQVGRLRLRRGMRHRFDSQLAHYLWQVLRLDLGYSSLENRRVAQILAEGIGPTLALTLPILVGGIGLALALSLGCAQMRGRWTDRLLVVLSVVLMSVNYVVWIVLGQYVFGFRLGWFPVWGFESWRYLLLPVGIGILSGLGADLRFYRTVMIEEMHREHVQAARAKGLGPVRLLTRHVLPNALVPVLAQTAAALPFLYTGSLLLESFFGIPGLGYVGVNAVNSADVDVLRAVVLVGAVLFMAVNLLADLAYAAVDPRVRLE